MLNKTKTLVKSGLLILSSLSAFSSLAEPILKSAPIEKIFTIRGFDDNDFVEVVAYGKLPSTCYKLADASAVIDSEDKIVHVKVNALQYEQPFCIQVQVPYFKVIELGVMQQGAYEVKTNDAIPNTIVEIDSSSTNDQSDHLYAPVDSATIEKNTSALALRPLSTVRLKGTFPYMFKGCMVMKEIKSYYTPEKVLVVMPIAEVRDDNVCKKAERHFDIRYPINYELQTPSLLHVRVMNGEALNQLLQ